MSQVVTFTDYTPPARYDAVPWNRAQIEESTSETGVFTTIDTVSISPVDADPSQPQPRNFTTSNGSDGEGLWYRIVFLDASDAASQATDPVQNPTTPSDTYITASELKDARELAGYAFADGQIPTVIEAASRVIDRMCGMRQRFWADQDATKVRYYTPCLSDRVDIDPIIEVTSVQTDNNGDGVYENTWTLTSDYILKPDNAAADGEPWTQIRKAYNTGLYFPCLQQSVKITGRFGWAAVPAEVWEATMILSTRYLLRAREAPSGILTVGGPVEGSMMRLARTDPDIPGLLSRFNRSRLIA